MAAVVFAGQENALWPAFRNGICPNPTSESVPPVSTEATAAPPCAVAGPQRCVTYFCDTGWDGVLSIECYGTDENIGKSVRFLREMLA